MGVVVAVLLEGPGSVLLAINSFAFLPFYKSVFYYRKAPPSLSSSLRAVITGVLRVRFLGSVFSFRVGTVQNVFHQENSESWQWDLGLA